MLGLGRSDEALQFLKEARRLFPGSPRVSDALADTRRRIAKAALAKKKQEIRRRPRLDSYLKISDLYRTLGDFPKAFHYLEEAESRFEEHWSLHLTLGKLHFSRFREQRDMSDAETSVEHLSRADELRPSNYQILIHVALVNTHLGRVALAQEAVEAVLTRFPNDPKARGIRKHLERCEEQVADAEEAAATEADSADSAGSESAAGRVQSAASHQSGETTEATDEIQRVASETGAVGSFLVSEDGSLAFTSVSENTELSFDACEDTIKNMVAECRYNAGSIGIGEFQSCHLSGADWQVYIRAQNPGHALFFTDQSAEEISLNNAVEQELSAEVPA